MFCYIAVCGFVCLIHNKSMTRSRTSHVHYLIDKQFNLQHTNKSLIQLSLWRGYSTASFSAAKNLYPFLLNSRSIEMSQSNSLFKVHLNLLLKFIITILWPHRDTRETLLWNSQFYYDCNEDIHDAEDIIIIMTMFMRYQ